MGSTREAIWQAFEQLERETGRTGFRVGELTERVRAIMPEAKASTVRTQITSAMCVDAPSFENSPERLRRMRRGVYRRDHSEVNGQVQPSETEAADEHTAVVQSIPSSAWGAPIGAPRTDGPPAPGSVRDVGEVLGCVGSSQDEGNIHASMVRHLSWLEWSVDSTDTSTRAATGVDLVAEKDGRRVLVEVAKLASGHGMPTTPSPNGVGDHHDRAAFADRARNRLGEVLMSNLLYASEEPEVQVVICLPADGVYRDLVERIDWALNRLGFDIAWVQTDGSIDWEYRSDDAAEVNGSGSMRGGPDHLSDRRSELVQPVGGTGPSHLGESAVWAETADETTALARPTSVFDTGLESGGQSAGLSSSSDSGRRAGDDSGDGTADGTMSKAS